MHTKCQLIDDVILSREYRGGPYRLRACEWMICIGGSLAARRLEMELRMQVDANMMAVLRWVRRSCEAGKKGEERKEREDIAGRERNGRPVSTA